MEKPAKGVSTVAAAILLALVFCFNAVAARAQDAPLTPTIDIIFQHKDGRAAVHEYRRGVIVKNRELWGPGSWRIVDFVDVDSDGSDDLIFQEGVGRGPVGIQFLKNGRAVDQTYITPHIEGTAVSLVDVDGINGRDLVYQTSDGSICALMFSDVATPSRRELSTRRLPVPADQRLIGMADVTGDGKVDVITQQRDGTVRSWLTNGFMGIPFPIMNLSGPSSWGAHVRDVNRDGNADVLWQNTDGSVAVHYLGTNGRIIGMQNLTGPTEYKVAAVGGAPLLKWWGPFKGGEDSQTVMLDGDTFYIGRAGSNWNKIGTLDPAFAPASTRIYASRFDGSRMTLAAFNHIERRWLYGQIEDAGNLTWSVPPDSFDAFRLSPGAAILGNPSRGNTITQADPAPLQRFTVTREDNLPGTGLRMVTSASVETDGSVRVLTEAFQATWLRGATGSALVSLVGDNGENVWSSHVISLSADARITGRDHTTYSWTDQAPLDALRDGRRLVVVHAYAPQVDMFKPLRQALEWLRKELEKIFAGG